MKESMNQSINQLTDRHLTHVYELLQSHWQVMTSGLTGWRQSPTTCHSPAVATLIQS